MQPRQDVRIAESNAFMEVDASPPSVSSAPTPSIKRSTPLSCPPATQNSFEFSLPNRHLMLSPRLSRERLESMRRRRKHGSVLQVIQALEKSSSLAAVVEDHDEFVHPRHSKKWYPSASDSSTCTDVTDDDMSDDDASFVSALSSCDAADTCTTPPAAPHANAAFAAQDHPFEIGLVTPPRHKPSRKNARRHRPLRRYSFDDFCNNDLARQIEAMALEVETEYENRRRPCARS